MANTTNFNWETPDDTDLVKDGAAAMRTLGNSIDSSFVDLKGGTTGQVLSKASNTDLDYTWVTTDDANAIQNAIVDAKGDLIAASAADTPARLAVGANNTYLMADSTQSTGLKYVGFQGATPYNSTASTIPNNTWTSISMNSEYFDTDGFHSTSTNTARLTIPTGMGGKYLVTCNVLMDPNANGYRQLRVINQDLTPVFQVGEISGVASRYLSQSASFIIGLSAGNWLELQVFQTTGGNLDYYARGGELPFTITYLGA
jgi:hypothetical protein